jgi:hypothetical protein
MTSIVLGVTNVLSCDNKNKACHGINFETVSFLQKLEFTLISISAPPEPGQLTPELIHEELTKLLIANPKQSDIIIEWIEVKYLLLLSSSKDKNVPLSRIFQNTSCKGHLYLEREFV